ncbi:MAG: hypothetical protein DRI90_10780, partial [Deltaproteobacteria bacterium]
VDAGPITTAPTDGGVTDGGVLVPFIVELRLTAQRIDDLSNERLDVTVEPPSLFRVDLDLLNDDQVAVEAQRLSLILAATMGDAGIVDGGTAPDAGGSSGPVGMTDAGVSIDDELWDAQLALDRAREQFLALPAAKRIALLDRHGERQREAEEAGAGGTDAERRAKRAAQERAKSLEEAKQADTASLRLVAEERARLNGVQELQAKYDHGLQRADKELSAHVDEAIEWGAKVIELVEKLKRGEAAPAQADLLYDMLTPRLKLAREDLARAIAALSQAGKDAPSAGPSRLADLDAKVDQTQAAALHQEVDEEHRRLRDRAVELAWQRAEILNRKMESLRHARLALLPFLSAGQDSSLAGLGAPGIAQATEETRLALVKIHFHGRATTRWVAKLVGGQRDRSAAVGAALTTGKVLLILIVFAGWRRYLRRRVQHWRVAARDRRGGKGALRASHWEAWVSLLLRVRRPLEWLLLFALVLWLVGPDVSARLEVRLLWLICGWVLGGRLVVGVLDELLARQSFLSRRETETSKLRLRSLRLVARVTVMLGLTLALTDELVGAGTIYRWVTWLCWLVALPVGALILRWWRPTVFKRLETRQHHSATAHWVLSHRQGWTRMVATLLGSTYVFGVALARLLQSAFGRFDVTRRLLAYWFRREISRKAGEDDQQAPLEDIDELHYAAFAPDQPSSEVLPAIDDQVRARLDTALVERRGQLIALVGERGSGKSTLLAELADRCDGALSIKCPPGGLDEFREALGQALGLGEAATDPAIRRRLTERGSAVVLIDDVHRLVRSRIGGLEALDGALALLGVDQVQDRTWVVTVDAVTWRYVQRARGAQPVFDEVVRLEPWPESRIAQLLRNRSKALGIEPSFARLLTEDPIDELERNALLERAETNYYRLLWDYAGGNPAVALWFWRESLRLAGETEHVVQLFEAPVTDDLEGLPDHALFVLRAIVQIDRASSDDVLAATKLPDPRVREALRYARLRGYLEVVEDRYWVSWAWFRAITRVLHRRHLLGGGPA